MRRREALALGVAAGATLAAPARAADFGTFKIGVLKFGTVNWELDVIKHAPAGRARRVSPSRSCRSAATTRPTWR